MDGPPSSSEEQSQGVELTAAPRKGQVNRGKEAAGMVATACHGFTASVVTDEELEQLLSRSGIMFAS
jgi:hypothetical protein